MVAFDFTGSLPQYKALISSAQLRNRFNDIKTHLLTVNALGLTLPTSVASAAQYQAVLLNSGKTGFDFNHVLRADGAVSITGTASLVAGDIIYHNGTNFIRLAKGTTNQLLVQGASNAPEWQTVPQLTDGDKGDVVVSSSGTNWTIDNNAITNEKMADNAIDTAEIVNNAVTTAKIANANVTFNKIAISLTIKTTTYTAVANDTLGCDTSSGAWTLTFPASASAGDKIFIVDYKNTFDTKNLTINPNGLNIENQSTNLVLDIKGFSGTFVYDATVGWKRT